MSNYNIDYKNESWTSADGFKAQVLEYYDYNHITIRFEDGFERNVTAQSLRNNTFVRHRVVPQRSLNECAVFYYLSQIGFIQPDRDYMKQFGFYKGETYDMYNPDLKIAVEYDGMGHTYKKDHYKNEISKKNNIHIYRIREQQLGLLNDGIAKEFVVHNHWFPKDLEEHIQLLLNHFSTENNITVNFKKDRKAIFKLYNQGYRNIHKETKKERIRRETKELNKYKRNERNKKVLKYVIENPEKTYTEISKHFKISYGTIRRILRNNNVYRYNKNNKTSNIVFGSAGIIQKNEDISKDIKNNYYENDDFEI